MLLQNLVIMVTRPSPQGEELCQWLQEAGAMTVFLPMMEILPPEQDYDVTHLDHYDVIIFISPKAIDQTKEKIKKQWPIFPPHVKVLAVGESTAKALKEANIPVHGYPDKSWSSEGLLELPLLKNVSGKKIAIIRGETGRNLLQEVLAQRGAKVENVIAYRRVMPKIDIKHYRELLCAHKIDIIICTSTELLQNLITRFDVRSVPLMVISQRMFAFAKEQGFNTIYTAENASHHAIMSELVKHKDSLCQMKKLKT